jgi:hypothetical protein
VSLHLDAQLTTGSTDTKKPMLLSTARRGLVLMTISLQTFKFLDLLYMTRYYLLSSTQSVRPREALLTACPLTSTLLSSLFPINLYMSRVAYIWSSDLQSACDQLPCNPDRSSIVYDLHRAYGLLAERALTIVEPDLALGNVTQLTRFHDREYIGKSRLCNQPADCRSHFGGP